MRDRLLEELLRGRVLGRQPRHRGRADLRRPRPAVGRLHRRRPRPLRLLPPHLRGVHPRCRRRPLRLPPTRRLVPALARAPRRRRRAATSSTDDEIHERGPLPPKTIPRAEVDSLRELRIERLTYHHGRDGQGIRERLAGAPPWLVHRGDRPHRGGQDHPAPKRARPRASRGHALVERRARRRSRHLPRATADRVHPPGPASCSARRWPTTSSSAPRAIWPRRCGWPSSTTTSRTWPRGWPPASAPAGFACPAGRSSARPRRGCSYAGRSSSSATTSRARWTSKRRRRCGTGSSTTAIGTVLAVSHRRGALQRADQVVVLRDGRVDDVGPLPEVLPRCEEMRRLWRFEGAAEPSVEP